jgi:LysM repeat protein
MTTTATATVEDDAAPRPARGRRLATSTGATLAIAAVGLTATAGAAHADEQYTVRSGDTVSHIAARYGTTVSAVRSANGLDARAFIREGQHLTIPTQATSSPAVAAAPAAAAAGSHAVVSGETVSSIAKRYGTTVSAIVSANGLDSRAFIRAGQTLTIPGATTTTAAATTTTTSNLVGNTFAGRTYAPAVVASANQNKAALLSMGVPSAAQMQEKVAATARAMGVDASLAQAIAFQESGFNHSAVSPANAIGTMQVIPSSGEWASQLVGRQLNLLDPDDNVVAGVAILRSLLKSSGGDLPTAIAGYYQGATSVKKNGMFADTRRYVANVQTLMTRY